MSTNTTTESTETDTKAETTTHLIPASVTRSRNGRRQGRMRGNNKKQQNTTEKEKEITVDISEEKESTSATTASMNPANMKSRKKRTKKKNKKKKKWWKNGAIIPSGEVDPISLEPIEELQYPPFILAATEPYDVICFPGDEDDDNMASSCASVSVCKDEVNTKWHLFDGRVLAYYLVSQMQFIDPLNRRELSREELMHLDEYLKLYNLIPASPNLYSSPSNRRSKGRNSRAKDNNDGVVIEAFNSIERRQQQQSGGHNNTSGNATRAEVLQREAADILSALFGQFPGSSTARQRQQQTRGGNTRGSRGVPASTTIVNTGNNNAPSSRISSHLTNFMSDFERIHREEEIRLRNQMAATAATSEGQNGSNRNDYGMVIIDDDLNPGLRGQIGSRSFINIRNSVGEVRTSSQNMGGSSTSSHPQTVTASNTSFPSLQEALPQVSSFPPLSISSAPVIASGGTTTGRSTSASSSNKPSKSSSLSHISKLIKPTKASDLLKARRARETAMQRATTTHLTFEELQQHEQVGMNNDQAVDCTSQERDREISPPSQSMIQRNIKLADALGVTISSQKDTDTVHVLGQTRSLQTSHDGSSFSGFDTELIAVNYPDSLIKDAKENMELIRKLEKRWSLFLRDDKSRSFQCNPMPKILRRLVHEYSDFWFLNTESFDPQPKRYVNCVKTANTKVPSPLLSVAIRNWRGPQSLQQNLGGNNDEKVMAPVTATSRFSVHTVEDNQVCERPKLKLAPRSLPTELPPFKTDKQKLEEAFVERLKAQEEENERKTAENKHVAHDTIFDALAEDSDDGDDGSSVWTAESAPYHSDDE